MGFSNQERINMNSKALSANVIDANPIAQWYETRNPFAFLLSGNKILTQLALIPSASSLAVARSNASSNPTLISDLSQTGSAVRLTPVAGTNNSTYIAYTTYNDTSSAILDNWLQPQLIPQSNGSASIGYSIILYDGNPATTGSEVTTTDGTTGTGQNKSVGWVWNYAGGLLLLSDDFKGSVSDPYVMGFRYIGSNANDATSNNQSTVNEYVADESISIGDCIRFVTSSDSGLTAGRIIKSSATNVASGEVVGIAKTSGSQGSTIQVVSMGRANVKFSSAPASTLNGQTVFLSTASGQGTTTPPSSAGNSVVKLGKITGADNSTTTPLCLIDIDQIIIIG